MTCAVVPLGLVLFAALGMAPSAGAWTWPLDGDVLRPYSLGADAYAPGQHRGVDVAGASGEIVRAPASGTVSFAGVVPGSGRTVTIEHDGYAVSLTHLGEIAVAKGAVVAEGDGVGVAGQSGEAEWPSPYAHLGIRVSAAADGYVDPATLLPPRSVVPPAAGRRAGGSADACNRPGHGRRRACDHDARSSWGSRRRPGSFGAAGSGDGRRRRRRTPSRRSRRRRRASCRRPRRSARSAPPWAVRRPPGTPSSAALPSRQRTSRRVRARRVRKQEELLRPGSRCEWLARRRREAPQDVVAPAPTSTTTRVPAGRLRCLGPTTGSWHRLSHRISPSGRRHRVAARRRPGRG